jgi:hypothetical protein
MHAPGRRPVVRRDSALRLVAFLALAGFAGWEGVLGRFSTASHVSILATVAAVLGLALVVGRGRQREAARTWVLAAGRAPRDVVRRARAGSATATGALVWTCLIAVTIAWDAVSFTAQRHSLPTLSRIFGAVTDHQWGRALVFAGWLALGLYLAVGWRLTTGRPRARRTGSWRTRRPSRPAAPDGDPG